ncbi:MAG: protealysin inhibitor emfourin [Terriglobales bacterium]
MSLLAIALVSAPGDCEDKKQVDERAKAMIVRYEKTGGFVATHKTCCIDSSKLDASEREKLHALVSESGIEAVKDKLKQTNQGAADVFYYDIRVEDNGKTHEVFFDDSTLPAKYRPLVTYLNSKCTR